jgi:hypothetical protein
MKKIIPLLLTTLIIFITSCSVSLEKYSQSTSLVDFSSYFNKGIYMTTGDYHSNYIPIGIIEATCYDGYLIKNSIKRAEVENNQNMRDDLYGSSITSDKIKDYDFKNCTLNDLLDNMYSNAKEKSANGIIRIEIQTIKSTTQSGIRIIGMAIKY